MRVFRSRSRQQGMLMLLRPLPTELALCFLPRSYRRYRKSQQKMSSRGSLVARMAVQGIFTQLMESGTPRGIHHHASMAEINATEII